MALGITSCDEKEKKPSENPFSDYFPSGNYYKPIDLDNLLATSEGGEYAANQIILKLADGVFSDEGAPIAEEIAASLGGQLVGVIKQLKLYQIELTTSSQGELDAALETARQDNRVVDAFRNFVLVDLGRSECEDTETDNYLLHPNKKIQFDSTGYFQMVRLVREFYEYNPRGFELSPVKVASSQFFSSTCGQFDKLKKVKMSPWIEAPSYSISSEDVKRKLRHGVATAGIIAADQDGQVVEGIASSVLKEKFWFFQTSWAPGAFEYLMNNLESCSKSVSYS